jgi:hypothetical protein
MARRFQGTPEFRSDLNRAKRALLREVSDGCNQRDRGLCVACRRYAASVSDHPASHIKMPGGTRLTEIPKCSS